jgi:hypothetical protein
MKLMERARQLREERPLSDDEASATFAEPLDMLDGSDPSALAAAYKSGERQGPKANPEDVVVEGDVVDTPEQIEAIEPVVSADEESTSPELVRQPEPETEVLSQSSLRKYRKILHTIHQTTGKLPEGTTPEDRFRAVSEALATIGEPVDPATKPGKFWGSVRDKRRAVREHDRQLASERPATQPSKEAPINEAIEDAPQASSNVEMSLTGNRSEPAMSKLPGDRAYADVEGALAWAERAKQERHIARGHAAIADLVKFDANYMGHQDRNVSGRRAGAFMSNYELDQIAAHQDLIRDHLDERRAELAQTSQSELGTETTEGEKITFWNSPGAYLGGKMAEAGAWLRSRTPEQKKKDRWIVGGVLGAAALVGTVLAFKYGVDHSAAVPSGRGVKVPTNEFGINFDNASKEALTVHKGEGIYQTLKELGIPKSKWHEVLTEYGPKLVKKGLAYKNSNIGGFGWNKPMKLTVDQLKAIFNK